MLINKINNNLFFKKFNYQTLTQFNLVSVLTHFSSERYENSFNKIYLINKNSYLNNIIINIQFALKNYKNGLNMIYYSFLKGARGLILDSFEFYKKKTLSWIKYKQLERNHLSKKLNEFIILRLQRRKNFHIHFYNYNTRGLFTNFRTLSKQYTRLKKNPSLYSFMADKINRHKKDFNISPGTLFMKKGLHFLPDIIITNKIHSYNWWTLTNEINYLQIPFIYLTDHQYLVNKNYPIISSTNDLTCIFFELVLNKLFLKSLIIKYYRFKLKSFKEKIKFKKTIFHISLTNKTKKLSNFINQSKSFNNLNKIELIKTFNCWAQIIKRFKQIFNKKKIFKRIFITTRYRFLLFEKLFLVKRWTLLSFFYQILKKKWIKRKNWPKRKLLLNHLQAIHNNNATKSPWFRKNWWKKKKLNNLKNVTKKK